MPDRPGASVSNKIDKLRELTKRTIRQAAVLKGQLADDFASAKSRFILLVLSLSLFLFKSIHSLTRSFILSLFPARAT